MTQHAGIDSEIVVEGREPPLSPEHLRKDHVFELARRQTLHLRAGPLDVSTNDQLWLRPVRQPLDDPGHSFNGPMLFWEVGIHPSRVQHDRPCRIGSNPLTEIVAVERKLGLVVEVELRSSRHEDPVGSDMRVNSQQVAAHFLVPDEVVVVWRMNAGARRQIVPGEDKTRGGNSELGSRTERLFGSRSVDMRAVKYDVGPVLPEQADKFLSAPHSP